MDPLKKNILNCLKGLKGSGKFISIQSTEFLFPGLEIDGVGEIAYPINEGQAKAIIKVAHKAPFGKGSKTILDHNVRSGWEIDAYNITFNSSRWTKCIDKILSNIKPDLGLEDYTISAHLYKMLIYEKGDFFLPHKDSEKEKGMFGTLIIGLPSKHTGGELVVSFEGIQEIANFSESSGDYKIDYAAFYADCDHEVKPITSGCRVCLVYNLIQQNSVNKIKLNSIESYVDKLAGIFTKQRREGNTKPHIVLLGHQYTPENFSESLLKLNDRPKAEVLFRAAQKAGCYAKMCLVTSYLSGMPEEDGRYYKYGEDSDANAAMAEVYEEELYIQHWLENKVPALTKVGFVENDLITSFDLNEGEPILKESTGYMGNYGPDLMHWYHYGAVMIWSPDANAQLFPMQNPVSKMEWISYFSKNLNQISKSEILAVENILSTVPEKADKKANYNAIADWVINRNDKNFFLKQDNQVLQFYFTQMDTNHWLKLFQFFPIEITEKILVLVTKEISLSVVERLFSILAALSSSEKPEELLLSQLQKLPQYLSDLSSCTAKRNILLKGTALLDLIRIDKKMPQTEQWIKSVTEIITRNQDRNYIHQVLVPNLLAIKERALFVNKLLNGCHQYLQERVNKKPQPPADWSRKVPVTTEDKKQWQLLKAFLESPDENIFEYRKNQPERNALEYAIRKQEVDLKTETIRKGSPHTLRISKTMDAYNRNLNNWEEDLELLTKIESI
jgi:hypothetical protein